MKKKAKPKRSQFPLNPEKLKVKPDTYGYYYNEHGHRAKRHPKCRCKVPCQMRFTCRSPHHFGRRSTPWCTGSSGFGGPEDEWCDDCWYVKHGPKEKKNFGVVIKFVDNRD